MGNKNKQCKAAAVLFSLIFSTICFAQTSAVESSANIKRSVVQNEPLFVRNLTREAANRQIMPISGIETEMQKVIEVIGKSTKNNPVLIDDFAGKSELILGNIALHLLKQEDSSTAGRQQIIKLDIAGILSASANQKQAEETISRLLDQISRVPRRVILFIDDAGALAKTNPQFGLKIAGQLRQLVIEGKIRIISTAATTDAFNQIFAVDTQLNKLFQPVALDISEDELKNPFVGDKISPDIRKLMAGENQNQKVRAILQTDNIDAAGLRETLRTNGIDVISQVGSLNMLEIDMPIGAAENLISNRHAKHLSLNLNTSFLGHVESTTGAAALRSQPGNSDLDGRNIGIAIVDSAVYDKHHAFLDPQGILRVTAKKQFAGGGTNDRFGHGTHVAAIAAGGSGDPGDTVSQANLSNYRGIAPRANIIAVRALDNTGQGTSIQLLQSLNWVFEKRFEYNIRVVNLSLGTPAVESWQNDPLCRAVRRLVDSGIVVVAAAGNHGKDAAGNKVYGLIHSPGNDPSVITVGATNTFGTDRRSDDGIASYSSRGPTRSYWTDETNERHYDNVIKPDLVAPGNKIISAASKENALISEHSELRYVPETKRQVDNSRQADLTEIGLMRLSGTSMAAPVVAGTVALMLQANPNITPNMVKMILQYSAQPIAGFNMLEQGAGQLNIDGAVRLANLVRRDLSNQTSLNTPMLTAELPVNMQRSQIANENVVWSRGVMLNKGFGVGTEFITKYQKTYGLGLLLSDGILLSDGMLLSDGILMSDGLILSDGLLLSDGILMSDGTPFCDLSDMFSETGGLPDGVMFSDGILMSDGLLLSDGGLQADAVFGSSKILSTGDDGRMMY